MILKKFQSTFLSLLNGYPTLYKDQSIGINDSIVYMTPKLLTTIQHDTMLNLVCNYGVIMERCFQDLSNGVLRAPKLQNFQLVKPKKVCSRLANA